MTKNVVKVDSDLVDIIPVFMENRHREIPTLWEALETEDYEKLRITGHTLKGIGGGYGFDEITNFGAAIEQAAKAGVPDKLKTLLTRYQDYLNELEVVFS